MTTIAYKDGILAADTLVTGGNTRLGHAKKIHRLSGGRLFAAAGTVDDTERLLLSLQNKRNPPELEDVQGILVERDGSWWLYEGSVWFRYDADHITLGSGSDIATGAMDAGATAEQAVLIACKRDVGSGEPIQVEHLKKGKA